MLKSYIVFLFFLSYSCSHFRSLSSSQRTSPKESALSQNEAVQTEAIDKEALTEATRLTEGWPQSSVLAAKEIISKYGSPQEKTAEMLIWRNVAPFKKIIVHKEVYSHRFPLLHQNSLQHIVEYKAPESKVDDIWKYNGSIVLDRTKGEMSSFAENEAMNILALNLAHDIMMGHTHYEKARITFGRETMDFKNGKKSAYTSVLNFGNQFQTADQGESITKKIRWMQPKRFSPLRQAQEEKK